MSARSVAHPARSWLLAALTAALVVGPGPAGAQPATPPDGGTVTVPLERYEGMDAALRHARTQLDAVPVGVTLSRADVVVDATGDHVDVTAEITAHILRDDWVQVRLLPVGTALASAEVDGRAVALSPVDGDLVWTTKGAGERRLVLRYRVARQTNEAGGSVDVPVPPAAALNLRATLPTTGSELAVAPAVPFDVVATGAATTELRATFPRTSRVHLGWRLPGGARWLITEATYRGAAREATMAWEATIALHVFGDGPLRVPIAPDTAAIAEVRADGRPAVVEETDGAIAVRLQGRGAHVVTLRFETPIATSAGPTSTSLWVPRPPVASFILTLPGDKEVTVEPAGGVTHEKADGSTVARVHLPPTHDVTFRWSEALPPDVRHQLRANAETYHVVRAEEGVLHVAAHVVVEVTRGATNRFVLAVPDEVIVNQVRGEGVSDWRMSDEAGARRLTVFLDRDVTDGYRLEVDYERLFPPTADEAARALDVPLLRVEEVHRQRGWVALARGAELEMKPAVAAGMSAVGENQLPAWLRDGLAAMVTHTYKYVEDGASLSVTAAPYERERARFDAQVDTLLSLGEGVLSASATVRVTVKSGTLMALQLLIPSGINVLGAQAPSLREHRVVEPAEGSGEPRRLELTFTREVEGTLTIEVSYERVLTPGDDQLVAPLVHVEGASLEAGRVGLEALSAVEVDAAAAERLLPMDARELPRQLVLQTTNPLLLAYKYVHAVPAPRLVLAIERHEELAVQVAAIDHAHYRTLWTRDGVSLTRARYVVRNRGKQFLRVALPAGAEVWSALMNGAPVKPARAGDAGGNVVLLPLSSAAEPFSVELVYVERRDPLGFAGTVEGVLPRPDIVETRTQWDVFLPSDYAYGDVDSTLTVVRAPGDGVVTASEAGMDGRGEVSAGEAPDAMRAGALPLAIEVPEEGRLLTMTKLLANQAERRAAFTVSYRSERANLLAAFLAFFGTLVLALTVRRAWARGERPGPAVWAVGAGGLIAAVVGVAVLGAGVGWALGALVVVAILVFAGWILRRRAASEAAPRPETPGAS